MNNNGNYSKKNLDLSCIIITFNEQDNIERCLNALPQGAEIIIIDSFSTDKTCEICSKFNVKIYQRHFTNYADQKNTALKYATKNWILSIDADEIISTSFKKYLEQQEFLKVVAKMPQIEGFYIKRNLIFLGKLMRFGKTCDYPIRLFKKKNNIFIGDIHEKVNIPKSNLKYLRYSQIYHYSYKNLDDYFTKFNTYTTQYAKTALEKHCMLTTFKQYTFILRPYISFIIRYFLRLGFLDGYAGYCYAITSSFYEFIKYAKIYELQYIQAKKAENK